MTPVLKLSSFNNPSELCENDIPSISVKITDFRLAVENVYKAEGMTATGKSKSDGVLNDSDINSVVSRQCLPTQK